MNPGILITHVRASSADERSLHTDHAGFVGVVTPSRWPLGATPGAVVEVEVRAATGLDKVAAASLLDPATRAGLRAYFANGGERATAFGVCIRAPSDLATPHAVARTLEPLRDRLRSMDEVSLIAAPAFAYLPTEAAADDVVWPGGAAWLELLSICAESGHRFLIVDPPRGLDESDVRAWARRFRNSAGADASFAALYWPWLAAGDTVLPPSGAIVGTYARVDLANAPMGVRVAPANVDLRGWTDAEANVGFRDAGVLLEDGVNPIVASPGRGLVVWGARTLSQDERWRQVTARRIVSVITERLRRDAEWIVFESMRPELWQVAARMVRSRLDGFWSAGMLTGDTAGAEYAVQCDEETNPRAVVDRGEIHVSVRMRPVTATEFVDIELQLGR